MLEQKGTWETIRSRGRWFTDASVKRYATSGNIPKFLADVPATFVQCGDEAQRNKYKDKKIEDTSEEEKEKKDIATNKKSHKKQPVIAPPGVQGPGRRSAAGGSRGTLGPLRQLLRHREQPRHRGPGEPKRTKTAKIPDA